MLKIIRKIFSLSRYSLLSLVALGLGFGRELVVSSHFGLSKELDVYVAIQGFYLFFGVQIANTLEMVFISKGVNIKSDVQTTAQLFSASKILLLTNLIVAISLHIYAAQLIAIFFPGFSTEQTNLGIEFIDYFLIAIVFANFSGLFRASLNILRIFSPGLLSGAIVSIVSAIAVIFFSETCGINSLVYGFISGNGLSFMILTLAYIKRIGRHNLYLGIKLKPISSGLWKAAFIVFLGEVCYQGFNMTERSYASNFTTGTISAFYYAWTLVAVPLSVVITPLSTVIYPQLAQKFATDKWQGYLLLKKYAIPLFIFSLLIVSGVAWLSEYVVKLIFMRGSFSESDAEKTASILSILIFSLPFSSFGRLVRYSLYSLSNYKAASLSQLVTLVSFVLISPQLIPQYGVVGLAYACTLALSLQSIFMLIILRIQISNANK